jgi:hypothetical protein
MYKPNTSILGTSLGIY